MNKVSLTLFAFHLRHTITDPPHQIHCHANYLFDTLFQKSQTTLPFPQLAHLKTHLTTLTNQNTPPQSHDHYLWLSNGKVDLGIYNPVESDLSLQAELSPLWITEDTYVIDLTLFPHPNTQALTPDQLPLLQPQALLFTDIPPTFLGQILWLHAEISPNDHESAETLADQCAASIAQEAKWQRVIPRQVDHPLHKLDHQYWFEYKVTTSSHLTYRLLITFNLQLDILAEYYDWLLQLFCCQQKIRFIRHQALNRSQAREIYSQITAQVTNLDALMPNLDHNFTQLSTQILTTFPRLSRQCSTTLTHLKTHLTSLETNLTNLKINLNKLEGNIPTEWHEDLKTAELWRQQIQIELDYLQPAHDLLTQTIQTIRGITENIRTTRTTQATRQFQLAGLLASSVALLITTYTRWVDHPWQWPQSLFPPGYVLDPVAFAFLLVIGIAIPGFLIINKIWISNKANLR